MGASCGQQRYFQEGDMCWWIPDPRKPVWWPSQKVRAGKVGQQAPATPAPVASPNHHGLQGPCVGTDLTRCLSWDRETKVPAGGDICTQISALLLCLRQWKGYRAWHGEVTRTQGIPLGRRYCVHPMLPTAKVLPKDQRDTSTSNHTASHLLMATWKQPPLYYT